MQDTSIIRESILRMAGGSFEERMDVEMAKVIQNIMDPNTKATAKRKITMEFEITPDEDRSRFAVVVSAKSRLAPLHPVGTSLCVTSDENGEMIIAEMVPQIPGQVKIDGTEQESPKFLKLLGKAE